ncbi:MAG: SGNH/GDSL hydrolase family protein [Myxococcales bacterium]|nr:SGNH/GDSL hydrolase family protein [Myxococcales bacterium]MCB9717680.1 SGNH/GDSL hydrolase family protein [Myxococcales bacterium]
MPRKAAPVALVALLGLVPDPARAHSSATTEGSARIEAEAQPAEPAEEAAPVEPTWRWRQDDKPVKVVVLAGSIGAYRSHPYSEQLQEMCSNVEVRNISQTGLGAWALRKHFEQQVLDNSRLRWNVDGEEYWLVFGGGLNSVGNPKGNVYHMVRLFELAHRRGMKVMGLTIGPWGDESDKRWRGLEGLRSKRNTLHSVDFVLGTLTPAEAMGSYVEKRRVDADAPWDRSELPDVAVNLYDSRLRDRDAEPRDLEPMRELLRKDKGWAKAHAELDELQRETKLEADAQEAAELPRWFLRKELRSFDHIHPNADGHRIIAETICPTAPASWGCACPAPGSGDPTPKASP